MKRLSYSRIGGPRIALKDKVKEDCKLCSLNATASSPCALNLSRSGKFTQQEQVQEGMVWEVVTAAVASEGASAAIELTLFSPSFAVEKLYRLPSFPTYHYLT